MCDILINSTQILISFIPIVLLPFLTHPLAIEAFRLTSHKIDPIHPPINLPIDLIKSHLATLPIRRVQENNKSPNHQALIIIRNQVPISTNTEFEVLISSFLNVEDVYVGFIFEMTFSVFYGSIFK